MKIYATTPPTICVVAWFRRYATAVIVIALVGLVTLATGVAQILYSNTKPGITVSETSVSMNVKLDQHERHAIAR
jgi:hypothetical protein